MGRKYKGQAAKAAMMLFGTAPRRKMETKEQREQLALALRLSDNPKMKLLASQALDPIFRHTAMTTLAEKLALTFHDVANEYKAIRKAEGLVAMADHLPAIMEQVAVDATHRQERCPACKGERVVLVYDYEAIEKAKAAVGENVRHERPSDPRVELLANGRQRCVACSGDGVINLAADTDKLKLVFETFGLTGGKGAPVVNLDLRRTDAPESMADLSASVAPILEGTVKGEVQ